MEGFSRESIAGFFKELQKNICFEIEQTDKKGIFNIDQWHHKEGGGGLTSVIEKGNIIEKGGVNFSEVYGKVNEMMSKNLPGAADLFFATGVSIVMHPFNPFVPIIHMNVRYFELTDLKGRIINSWFGGGIDLTPHYVNEHQAKYFHSALNTICQNHDLAYYSKFKKWADDYFFIPHREETRGIGGIFFDQLNEENYGDISKTFDFVKDVGNGFAPLYTLFMKERSDHNFTEKNREWQLLRRGRYAEFNLVYDRGTRFGFESGGRTESILMSLPPVAQWNYNYIPENDSEEAKTLLLLKKDIDWLNK